jgi:crotonobetainyl-CoA:carnitine CoA-transferase CaiB-like acyl-CoA transferase
MHQARFQNTAVSAGPLTGLRVLELGSLIAAPFAARLLADLGADVLKVEAPDKLDGLRQWGAVKEGGRSLWWPVQSRAKRLVTLNLRLPRGQELCRELAARSDILIENFRPGTMERWGLGPEELRSVNPGLIYTRISGYGQTGRYADRPGFASVGEAMGGLRYLNGFPNQPPPRTGLSLGDSLCAMFAVIGTLAALRNRDAGDGEGQVVDASIVESCFALLESVVPEYQRLGQVRGPTGTAIANNAPSNIYRAADARWVVIAANADNLWPRLCRAIGREDLIQDPQFATHDARGQNMEALDQIIAAWVAERGAWEIDQQLNDAGVVCGPVYSVHDILADPYFRERDMLVGVMDAELGEVLSPGVVPKLSHTPGRTEFTAPWQPGEHNDEVFGELLGLSDEDLRGLAVVGVI